MLGLLTSLQNLAISNMPRMTSIGTDGFSIFSSYVIKRMSIVFEARSVRSVTSLMKLIFFWWLSGGSMELNLRKEDASRTALIL